VLEARLRVETEVQTLSRLSPHENIPTFYHYHGGVDGAYTYFVMEFG
jgi:serine/threonine protein kinase